MPRHTSSRSVAPLGLVLVVAVMAAIVAAVVPAHAATVTVVLDDGASPNEVTIGRADGVTILNDDDERHRLRARDPEDVDTDDIDPGQSVTVSFPVTGTYVMVDERSDDPAYTLRVVVGEEAPAEPPAPGSPPPPEAEPSQAPATADVVIPDRLFSPSEVTVRTGGTVTWTNTDGSHTVTDRAGGFDSGIFDSGTFAQTFGTSGTYDYLCTLHPEMTGRVLVVDSDGTAPPPASAPAPTVAPTTDPASPVAPAAPPAPAAPAPPVAQGAGAGVQPLAVDIVDLAFSPAGATVTAGSTVTWTNRGGLPHTVTSSDGGPLDSGILDAGAAWSWTATTPATLDYLCTLHPEMTGRLVVVAAGAQAPSSVEPPGPGDGAGAGPAAPPASASPASPGDEPDADGVTVRAAERGFDPAEVQVEVGSTVTWEMADDEPHTVTGDAFDSGVLPPGETWSQSFDELGTYAYTCLVHPGMEGTVEVVTAAAATGATEAAPATDGPGRSTAGVGSTSSGLPFAATVLVVFIVAAFATGRVTATAR